MTLVNYIKTCILFVTAGLFFLITIPLHAQETESGLVIRPAILELNADRGSSYEFTLTLENDSSSEVYDLNSFAQKFASTDEEGIPLLSAIEESDPQYGWITFNEGSLRLQPRETKESTFVVTVPESADPGSYYFAISYSTSNEAGERQIVIDQEISALLFVTVNGAIERDVEFTEIEAITGFVDPFFDGFGLSYTIGVNGNTYLKPSGNVFIGHDLENPTRSLQLNPNKKILLPNTERTIHYVSKPQIDVQFLSNTVNIEELQGDVNEADLEPVIFGNQKYRAVITYVNDEGVLEQKNVEIEIFFFPWKLLVIILIALVAVGVVIKALLPKKDARSDEDIDTEPSIMEEEYQETAIPENKKSTVTKSKKVSRRKK